MKNTNYFWQGATFIRAEKIAVATILNAQDAKPLFVLVEISVRSATIDYTMNAFTRAEKQ